MIRHQLNWHCPWGQCPEALRPASCSPRPEISDAAARISNVFKRSYDAPQKNSEIQPSSISLIVTLA